MGAHDALQPHFIVATMYIMSTIRRMYAWLMRHRLNPAEA